MIIACPACKTRYTVHDSAIGEEGRTVRCAKCRNSWFQEKPEDASGLEQKWTADAGGAPDKAVPETGDAPAVEAQHRAGEPDAEQPEQLEPASESLPAADEGEVSYFDPEPPVTRRRRRFRLWAWAAVILVLVGAGAIAAVNYSGLPEWVPEERAMFAVAQPGLELDFPPGQQERYRLANGTEVFDAAGTITNASGETRRIPPVLIVLRDAQDEVVYEWEVVLPKRNLAPGESISINEAVADVPPSASFAEIGWKPE